MVTGARPGAEHARGNQRAIAIAAKIDVDRTYFVSYRLQMSGPFGNHGNRLKAGRSGVAALLALAVSVCLVAASMGGPGSCQDVGPAPGLCGTAVAKADHFVVPPTPLFESVGYAQTSEILLQPATAGLPSFLALSTPDGRAPPARLVPSLIGPKAGTGGATTDRYFHLFARGTSRGNLDPPRR